MHEKEILDYDTVVTPRKTPPFHLACPKGDNDGEQVSWAAGWDGIHGNFKKIPSHRYGTTS